MESVIFALLLKINLFKYNWTGFPNVTSNKLTRLTLNIQNKFDDVDEKNIVFIYLSIYEE